MGMRAFLLCLALACPAAAQEAPPDGPSGEISIAPDEASDARIEDRLRSIIRELDGYEGVAVAVSEGIVTFSGEALDAAAIDRLDALAARVEGVVAVENEVAENTDVGDRLDPVLDRTRARIDGAVAVLPLLAIALVAGLAVAALGWLLAGWTGLWRRLAPNAFIAEIYATVLRVAFLLLGIVVALDILGAIAVLGTFLGAAGIVGLAIGFAVRDTVENFIASVMLSLRQPFRPGDFVEIEGDRGTVIRLTSRSTILLDMDGNHLRLPNATVFKARILNFTRNDQRRFGFVLGIDPIVDAAEARRIGIETLRGLDFTLDDPPPHAWIKDAGDWTIDMEYYAWLRQSESDFFVARSEAIRMVMAALTEAGIGLPEPTYRVNMVGGPAGGGAEGASEGGSGDAVTQPAAQVRAPEDVAPDRSVAEMARAERRAEADLLSESGPTA